MRRTPKLATEVASLLLVASVLTGCDQPSDSESVSRELVGTPASRLVLRGTVVAPWGFFDGEVLVVGDRIACVAADTACSTSDDALGATVLETDGVISAGLIDTHNHILFDIFDGDDWLPARQYANHDQWPREPRYQAMLDTKQCLEDASQGKPTWCPPEYDGAGNLKCEMDKWGELKALIAGTTSVVGLPGTSSACFGSLVQSIDVRQNGLGLDRVQTATAIPTSRATADRTCANLATGATHAYLVHLGEGVDTRSLKEWQKLVSVTTEPGCLIAPQTTITHAVAFTQAEFSTMAMRGTKLTWSPASNVALYGATADIPTAIAAGVSVALAPDWSMGGSQNLLDELRFADAWDDAHWNDALSTAELVRMTTTTAAEVVGYDDLIGSLRPGHLADLVVVAGDREHPFDAITAARPRDVKLTMIGGRALYGDPALLAAAPAAPGCEAVSICGASKFLCVAESSHDAKLDQTSADIEAALQQALLSIDARTAGDGYDFAPLAPLVACD